MSRTLFITASGTELGKTFVTCMLIQALKRRGQKVSAIKPLASGLSESTIDQSDPGLILTALGFEVTEATLNSVSPWRFAAPLAPPLAAACENVSVSLQEVLSFCRSAHTKESGELLLVEGAGGVMAPLTDDATCLDLIKELAAPTILVVGSYLGSVSHALTSQEVLSASGLRLLSTVVSESPGSSVSLDDTVDMVRKYQKSAAPVFSLPRVTSDEQMENYGDCLVTLLQM